MIKEFIKTAKKDNPVYISIVHEAFSHLENTQKHKIYCVLTLLENNKKRLFNIDLPSLEGYSIEEIDFVKSYLWAQIYNILSSLGGKEMTLYLDKNNNTLWDIALELDQIFCIGNNRSDRIRYGRAINVIDRMLGTLCPGKQSFQFIVRDISDMPEISGNEIQQQNDLNIFIEATRGLEGKLICGMDIGGTDIKTVLVKDGEIDCYKEYDWFPAQFTESKQLIDPVCLIIRLLRAKASLDMDIDNGTGLKSELKDDIQKALDKSAETDFMLAIVEKAESFLDVKLAGIDAIGLCFPDVVVRDKIVGGEVYKTRGIRNNPDIDYEKDFMQLTDLNDKLKELIKVDGVVKIINDGPMAAFTAAVEYAATGNQESVVDGIFAHTLGTELGTGWVDEKGEIPDIPLEVYNFIIDLGSFVEKQYPSDDLRSINNFNTELPGTLQKYCSQSGVFRLAMKYFPKQRPKLFQELLNNSFVILEEINGQPGYYVPTEPKDMRKPFLEHMMALPEREKDEVCDRIWKEIGQFIAATCLETEKILSPKAKARILFGRLVKNKRCVELMNEGARQIKGDIQLMVADSGIANTPLMKELEKDPQYTVAQFAQAIGAVYYGNTGLVR